VAVKGEFEITYFGGPDNPAPCGGVNYSAPYTALPPTDLAPGTVNTQNINGFLCSSPWVAGSPWTTVFAAGEYPLGIFTIPQSGSIGFTGAVTSGFQQALVVTNIAVYVGVLTGISSALVPNGLTLIHLWNQSTEVNSLYAFPGQAVSFVAVNSNVYFTGLMLQGIWVVSYTGSSGFTFQQATDYVCGRFIAELSGRLVVAECIFPGGGGTGVFPLPTIAWSGVGIFGQAWDGNPAHDVWNAANQAFFSGNIGGFNLLGDVPDQITGMATVGQTIVIVRTNGLTQQDPNSTFSTSGIQPYNWYHMWSSPQGVGGYAGTVAQFGQSLTFRSSDNVYTLSLSSGLAPVGNKIIARIVADQRTADNTIGVYALSSPSTKLWNSWWNFSSIYDLDGQLHYFLTFSSYTVVPSNFPSTPVFTCYGYDMNMADGSWHVWDFSKYFQDTSAGPGFTGFSCPMYPVKQTALNVVTLQISGVSSPRFLLFGAYSNYGTIAAPSFNGAMLQFVPFDYDFNSNWIVPYVSALYPPLSVPSPTIVFRGETLSLGHRIATRRLRLQADNAPMPTVQTGAQQQAQVTFTGAGPTETKTSPPFSMQGNQAPTGQPIRTYYGDVIVNSETVQPSLTSVFQPTNAWQTMCAFRIASASLIGNDATGTTQ
jgi:hypothetical protein